MSSSWEPYNSSVPPSPSSSSTTTSSSPSVHVTSSGGAGIAVAHLSTTTTTTNNNGPSHHHHHHQAHDGLGGGGPRGANCTPPSTISTITTASSESSSISNSLAASQQYTHPGGHSSSTYPPPPPAYLHPGPYHLGGHPGGGHPHYPPPYPGVGPVPTTAPSPAVIHPYPPPINVGNHHPYNHHHHQHHLQQPQHNIPPPHHHGSPQQQGPGPPGARPMHSHPPGGPGGPHPHPSQGGMGHHYPPPPNPYGPPMQPHPNQPPLSPTQITASSGPPSGLGQPVGVGIHHHPHHHHIGQVMVGQGAPPQGHHPYLKSPTGSSPTTPLGGGPMTPGGAVPQTPLGPPSGGNPFGAGVPELDLHPELINIGWRKFWSKRESRWYFWNCNTGDSLWEVPPIPGRHPPGAIQAGYDILTDPLGISGNGPAQVAGIKRRSSSGDHAGPAMKKFILGGPWDLEITSNVFSSESVIPNPIVLPPHPDVELARYQLIAKLRQCYQQSCQSREGIDAPKESMNRWIMERKVHDVKDVDPIFPACEASDGFVSQVMFKDVMNDIPIKIVKPRYTGDARKQLSKYAEGCKKIIETRNATAEARKLVKWKVEETFSWLRSTTGAPYEAFQERLAHLKTVCQPHVHAAAKSSVEGICKKMSVLSRQYAQNARETHFKLLVDPDSIKKDTQPEKGKYRCHPAVCGPYSFTDAGKLPTVEFMQHDREHVLLKHKTDVVRITTVFLQKLEQLYRYNCVDDRKFEFFLARTYCLIKRYNGFCEDFTLPHNTQGSLPVTVFESIQRNFGVTFECFASPLNCYFRQYCSAFPDTDGFYGSRGSFLSFKPVSGSFQVNPPFSDDLIEASITHIEDLLSSSKDPLSFIVFLPEFLEEKDGTEDMDPECSWLKRLENSRWKRKQITIPPFEHEFRHGAQHLVSKSEVSIRSSHATVVFWLQNDAGFDEWQPTEQKVDALIDSYRPGRERERDRQDLLAPERKNPQPADKAIAAAALASMAPT